MNLSDTFRRIYESNWWASEETRSGGGSTYARIEVVRQGLRPLLDRLGTRSLLDAGCGDWCWMQHVDLNGIEYFGCDIVEALVAETAAQYAGPGREFFVADITKDALPLVQVVLCRVTLNHLSLANVQRALVNFGRCGRYLIATNHSHMTENTDIEDGAFRPLNLLLEPFRLCEPYAVLYHDGGDGHLAVWTL
jgi:SAM-dependent methyltransferase